MNEDWIVGTPDVGRDTVAEYIEIGFGHFMLWFMDAPRTDGLDTVCSRSGAEILIGASIHWMLTANEIIFVFFTAKEVDRGGQLATSVFCC